MDMTISCTRDMDYNRPLWLYDISESTVLCSEPYKIVIVIAPVNVSSRGTMGFNYNSGRIYVSRTN